MLGVTGGLGAALLAACGGTGGNQAGGALDTKNHAPVTISTDIKKPGDTEWVAYEAAGKAIQDKYPWMKIDWLGGGSSSFDAMAKLVVNAASGSLPDIVYAQGTQIQYYINNKIVVSMTPYISKDKSFDINDFPKVAVDMYSRNGQVYAIPYDHGPILLYYNADLFKKNGVKPPDDKWTFDDLTAAATKLTNEKEGQWGIVDNGPTGSFSMPSYFGPWGGEWVDQTETKTQITSAASLQAMQYWYDLFFKHKVNPVPGTFEGSADTLYMQGKSAMRLTGPWGYRSFVGKINFESPIMNWPLGPTGKRISASMGSGYPITVNSKHLDESWLFMSELLGKDPDRSVLQQFVKTGLGTPCRVSVMKDFEKSKFAPPNVQIVNPAASYSVIGRPISPAKVDLDKVWSEERTRLLKQEVGVKEFLENVQRRVQPILDANKGWDASK
jgi:multiple sugar transport system substrate-binding protein